MTSNSSWHQAHDLIGFFFCGCHCLEKHMHISQSKIPGHMIPRGEVFPWPCESNTKWPFHLTWPTRDIWVLFHVLLSTKIVRFAIAVIPAIIPPWHDLRILKRRMRRNYKCLTLTQKSNTREEGHLTGITIATNISTESVQFSSRPLNCVWLLQSNVCSTRK